jgi:signal transduction histidine kinase
MGVEQGDEPAAGDAGPPRLDRRCRVCGYGIVAASAPPACPMCQSDDWVDEPRRPTARSASSSTSRSDDSAHARIVAAADSARRRFERDLHDGAQQQLVSLTLALRAARAAVPAELGELRSELAGVIDGLSSFLDELREIAHGVHPSILAEGGLGPALETLARRSRVPVRLDVRVDEQLPEPVELAAYYIVSEALANTAKYAQASVVCVAVEARDRVLRVAVCDDGIGGADPALGSGLLGLEDRAEAIGGTISLQSRPGAGTSLHVELPLDIPNPR